MFEHQECCLGMTSWKRQKKPAVSFEKGGAKLWLLSTRGYTCLFMQASLFVAEGASGCSDVKQQSWNRKVNLDFLICRTQYVHFHADVSTFVLFIFTCSSASMLSCFILLAMILIFADISQTLNCCCGGHLHQSLPSSFPLNQTHWNS